MPGSVRLGSAVYHLPMRVGSWIACAALASALGCSFGEEVGEGRRAEESAPPAASSLDPASLHREAIVVDTHADTTAFFADEEWHFGERHDAAETHVDLPRMREGGLDVEFWSIYVGAREQPGAAMRAALQRIDAVHRMVERHPEATALAGTVADVRRIVAEGRIASLKARPYS